MESLILNLSDDVLLEIFKFLDGRSLKKAALVCKNWDDVISSSSCTMKKLKLKLLFDSSFKNGDPRITEILNLKRNFHSMFMQVDNHDEENFETQILVQISSRHGSHIRNLTVNHVCFFSCQEFCEMLEKLPLLQILRLSYISFDMNDQSSNFCRQFCRLENLKVLESEFNLLDFFSVLIAPKIETLKVYDYVFGRNHLLRFLEVHENLTSLILNHKSMQGIFKEKIPESFRLKLKKISFSGTNQNFNEFLESQSASLEEVEVKYCDSPETMFGIIFTKMNRLKKLKVTKPSLPIASSFYERLPPMQSLKELIVCRGFKTEITAKGILKNCPNLELFKSYNDNFDFSELLPFMAINNPKIKNLSINSLLTNPEAVNFENLIHFEVVHVKKTTQNFLSFVVKHKTIESLSIESVCENELNENFLISLINQPNLRHLKFGKSMTDLTNLKIRADYDRLKSRGVAGKLFVEFCKEVEKPKKTKHETFLTNLNNFVRFPKKKRKSSIMRRTRSSRFNFCNQS